MKLNEIQQALKVPKNHRNDFGKYNYRNAEDILEAVKPLLGDSVLTITDEIECLGLRYYVKATATLLVPLEKGRKVDGLEYERHIVTAYAREEETKKGMDGAQITGAASSYARKYALNGLFLIDDTKDADSADNTQEAPAKPEQKKAADVDDKEIIRQALRILKKPHATMEQAEKSIMELTGIKLIPENYKAIIEELKSLAE